MRQLISSKNYLIFFWLNFHFLFLSLGTTSVAKDDKPQSYVHFLFPFFCYIFYIYLTWICWQGDEWKHKFPSWRGWFQDTCVVHYQIQEEAERLQYLLQLIKEVFVNGRIKHETAEFWSLKKLTSNIEGSNFWGWGKSVGSWCMDTTSRFTFQPFLILHPKFFEIVNKKC